MPTYEKSEDWLRQSSLLIEARPTTTRISTRYSLSPARRRASKNAAAADADATEPATTKPPRGKLVLKTFDPVSGATLRYHTSKAAEVSRLVQMLGRLGGRMAGVTPAAEEDDPMPDAPEAADSGAQTPVVAAPAAGGGGQQQQGGGGGGGKGKKKKGKR